MSKYYGQVIGQANTIASRRGSDKSGIRVSAQSWDGSVIVCMYKDKVSVEISDTSSAYGKELFSGTIEELKEKLYDLHDRQ